MRGPQRPETSMSPWGRGTASSLSASTQHCGRPQLGDTFHKNSMEHIQIFPQQSPASTHRKARVAPEGPGVRRAAPGVPTPPGDSRCFQLGVVHLLVSAQISSCSESHQPLQYVFL